MADDLGGAQAVTVVSPFFSAHHGLSTLASGLGCNNVSVAIPPMAPSIFDIAAAARANFQVLPVTCDHFEDNRSLHSKLFDIECAQGRLVVTGSANATTAALLGRNVEAVVVRPVDLAQSFGWRPTTRADSKTTGEREPNESSTSGLVVDYNSGVIVGRIMGTEAAGDWEALLSSGTRRQSAGAVRVADDNTFRFLPPATMDPIALGSAAQVIFARGDVELRGWLVLRDLIRAISIRGPIARAISRIISGLDSLGDIGAILDYFAGDPKPLFDASERSGGGRTDRQDAVRVPTGDLSVLKSTSALEMTSTWLGDAPTHSGDALIEALVRHLASAIPGSNDDGADDDDDDDGNAAKLPPGEPRKGNPPKRGPRLQRPIVERAFDQLFKKLEALPIGVNRASGLFVIFDMLVQIVPRTEAPDELLVMLMAKWIRAAAHARPTETDPTALDQCVSLLAARSVIANDALAEKMHGALQSWLGGALDEEFIELFEPAATGLEERRLYPGGSDGEWRRAWKAIVSSRTDWSVMNDLRQDLLAGGDVVLPEAATPEEKRILKQAADKAGRPDRIAYLKSGRTERQGCPRCGVVLSGLEQGRLEKHRIATCGYFRCGRVVIDISL